MRSTVESYRSTTHFNTLNFSPIPEYSFRLHGLMILDSSFCMCVLCYIRIKKKYVSRTKISLIAAEFLNRFQVLEDISFIGQSVSSEGKYTRA